MILKSCRAPHLQQHEDDGHADTDGDADLDPGEGDSDESTQPNRKVQQIGLKGAAHISYERKASEGLKVEGFRV